MPLGIDFAQIFLHLFNVVILFGGLYILLYSPVKKFMDEREEQYAKREKETSENLKASEAAKSEYENRLASVEDEISKTREEAVRSLEELKKAREQEARESGAEIIKQAEAAADRQRRKILAEVKDDIENIIDIATEKVVMGETQDINFDIFLDEAERSVADAK